MDSLKIKQIADKNGFNEASRQLFEEVGELIVAVNKYYRKTNKSDKEIMDCIDEEYLALQITEEICDTMIMIEQLKYLLNLNNDDIEKFIEHKLDRQLGRIDSK